MGSNSFYELIGLHDRLTPLNKKIDKKAFLQQLDLNSKEKQQLTSWIDRVVLAFLLAPQTINIHPYQDEDKRYDNVSFVTVSLKEDKTLKQIQQLGYFLHDVLPNPTIFLFTYGEKVVVCTALKRKNKVDEKKSVIEELRLSSWLNMEIVEETTKQFLETIHLSKLPFTSFFHFYSKFHYALELLEVAEKTGEFVQYEEEQLKDVQGIMAQISEVEAEIDKYRKMIKKETQFNRKAEYNVSIKKLKIKLEQLKSNIN